MAEPTQQSQPTGCPVVMSDDKPCGRPIYPAPSDVDEQPVCLMHSHDPGKDTEAFRDEIDAILAGTSRFHRPTEQFDFSNFIFPEANFVGVTFTRGAKFERATFTQGAHFYRASFTHGADFLEARFTQVANFVAAMFVQEANFSVTKFIQGADFSGAKFIQRAYFYMPIFTHAVNFSAATFTRGANFGAARFSEGVDFSQSVFGLRNDDPTERLDGESAVADFRGARFLKPDLVQFLRVNEGGRRGFQARFVDCLIKGVLFEDVDWNRVKGRVVLQDELDRLADAPEAASYEQVAAAYRRFIINFDEAKHYDLSEDCMIGAMEMKRLDPAKFLLAKKLGPYYEKWSRLRWLGEQVSVTNLYRLASNYGSSYVCAFWMLVLLLLTFAMLFALSGVSPNPSRNAGTLAPAGLIHAVEVVTFQSPTRYVAGNGLAWMLEQVERLLLPAQVALFLLALRRRFRR